MATTKQFLQATVVILCSTFLGGASSCADFGEGTSDSDTASKCQALPGEGVQIDSSNGTIVPSAPTNPSDFCGTATQLDNVSNTCVANMSVDVEIGPNGVIVPTQSFRNNAFQEGIDSVGNTSAGAGTTIRDGVCSANLSSEVEVNSDNTVVLKDAYRSPCSDCNGVLGGTALVDDCGLCVTDADTACQQDCTVTSCEHGGLCQEQSPYHLTQDATQTTVIGSYNGGNFSATPQGHVFIVEFPGSNSSPGSLHRVLTAGDSVEEDIESLPTGSKNIMFSPSGRMFTCGGNWSTTQVFEHDPTTGAKLATVFDGSPGKYASCLAADDLGRIYFVSESVVYRSTGTDTTSSNVALTDVPFVPSKMAFLLDGESAYVANSTKIGHVSGSGYVALTELTGERTLVQIAVDSASNQLIVLVSEAPGFMMPGQCEAPGGDCSRYIEFLSPSGEVLSSTEVDLSTRISVAVWDRRLLILTDAELAFYLLSTDPDTSWACNCRGTGYGGPQCDVFDEATCYTCGNGTALSGSQCVVANQISCGDGTVLTGSKCLPEMVTTCGSGTIPVGTQCVSSQSTCHGFYINSFGYEEGCVNAENFCINMNSLCRQDCDSHDWGSGNAGIASLGCPQGCSFASGVCKTGSRWY
jgi:hypothetical protein